jgi:hypothetical protein
MSEAAFFQIYGNVFSMYLADKREAEEAAEVISERRDMPVVKQALASIERGGYAQAITRVAALLARRGVPLPLERFALKQELAAEYADLLPKLQPHEWRKVRGEQEIIVRYEPERALTTLPLLLKDPADRHRLVKLMDRLLADERVQRNGASGEQLAMLNSINQTLRFEAARPRVARLALVKKGRGKRKS